MSDSGKIMLGTNGNPLVGAGGKIVLADRLYPYSLEQVNDGTRNNWFRQWSSEDMEADDLFSVDWVSGGGTARRTYWPQYGTYGINYASNRVYRIDLEWEYENYPSLSVPWSQVQPLSASYEITFEDQIATSDDYTNPQNVNGYVWYSWAAQEAPSGHEEVWLRDITPFDWTELRMGRPQNDGSTRVLSGSITIPKSPVPRAQLWVAEFFDSFTPDASLYGGGGVSFDISVSLSWPSFVKYNLAT